MTIEEAIEHCREREDFSKCGCEHKQLRMWLEELRERRKLVAESKNELKPCPFCGSEPIINEISPHKHYFVDFPDYEGGCFIECKCSCAISAKNRKEAIEKWNRRIE